MFDNWQKDADCIYFKYWNKLPTILLDLARFKFISFFLNNHNGHLYIIKQIPSSAVRRAEACNPKVVGSNLFIG